MPKRLELLPEGRQSTAASRSRSRYRFALTLKHATSTIPIVMFAVGDPVEQGFVASLARPGGNVTGVAGLGRAMAGKQIELLMQAAPHARHIGLVFNPYIPIHVGDLPFVEAAVMRQGATPRAVGLRSPDGIDAAVAALHARACRGGAHPAPAVPEHRRPRGAAGRTGAPKRLELLQLMPTVRRIGLLGDS